MTKTRRAVRGEDQNRAVKKVYWEEGGLRTMGGKRLSRQRLIHIPKVEIYLVQETKNPLQNSNNQLFIWDNEQKVSRCSAPIKLAGGFCPY